jgi:hypothetical protein
MTREIKWLGPYIRNNPQIDTEKNMTVIKMPSPKKKEPEFVPSPFDISKEMHKMQQRMIALEDMLATVIMFAESATTADMTEARKVLNGE